MGARLGWGEIVVILIIALIVLGPEKLPQLGRALGQTVRGVKKYIREAAQELEDFDELKDLKDDVNGIQKDLRSMGRNLEKSMADDMEELEKEADSAAKDIRSAMDNTEPAGSAPGAFETTTETDGEEPAVSDTKTQSQEEN